MITKPANLLLQFPEAAFDPETIAVQADDCLRGQSQTGAYKNALRIPIFLSGSWNATQLSFALTISYHAWRTPANSHDVARKK